jgi:hypothetical protein
MESQTSQGGVGTLSVTIFLESIISLACRIFIVEGLLAIVVGLLAKPLMWDWPADTKKLTPDERMLLKSRMDKDTEMAKMDRLDKKRHEKDHHRLENLYRVNRTILRSSLDANQ